MKHRDLGPSEALRSVVALVAIAVLFGCAPGGAAEDVDTLPASTSVPVAETVSSPSGSTSGMFQLPSLEVLAELQDDDLLMPMSALSLVGFDSSNQLFDRVHELVASCMQQRGWTYEHVALIEPVPDPLTVGQLKAFTADYGYGTWTRPTGNDAERKAADERNHQYFMTLTPDEQERYRRDYGDTGEVAGSGTSVLEGSCLDEAQKATGSLIFNPAVLAEVSRLSSGAMNTPAWAEINRAYAECVQDLGYDASLPQDMQMMVWGLGSDVPRDERVRIELEVAGADIKCRLETRIPYQIAVERALVEYIVERYPELAQWASEG